MYLVVALRFLLLFAPELVLQCALYLHPSALKTAEKFLAHYEYIDLADMNPEPLLRIPARNASTASHNIFVLPVVVGILLLSAPELVLQCALHLPPSALKTAEKFLTPGEL